VGEAEAHLRALKAQTSNPLASVGAALAVAGFAAFSDGQAQCLAKQCAIGAFQVPRLRSIVFRDGRKDDPPISFR